MTVEGLNHLGSRAVWEPPHVNIVDNYWIHQVLLLRLEPLPGGPGLGDVGEAVLFLPEKVDVKPIISVPAGQQPDVALGLGHGGVPGLAHHPPGNVLVKVPDDDPRSAVFQVLQILK